MSEGYVVYGGELSYFTRKLEAAMRFYAADFSIEAKTPTNSEEIELRSGTHQVPVLLTPENWMLADTTPIMQMLDSRFVGREMYPKGPLGLLTHILEEFFDEWVARTMVHYRWHYEESAVFASQRMANGRPEVAERIRNWGPRACRATGTDSARQQQQAEAEYLRIVAAMESQLGQTRYLLGDRPTALDCVMLGGLRAHTNMDPTPKKAIADYHRVIEWSETGADQWDGEGELAAFPESTEFARFVLAEMRTTYVPYVLGNADALAAGAKAFHVEIYDEPVSYLCRPYPQRSRQMVCARVAQLETEGFAAGEWLVQQGLDSCFGATSSLPKVAG